MDALLFELLPYVRQGYNCSQLLLVLAQRAAGEENPALLASVRGLGHGIGQSGGPCGLLSAGAVALTWLASPVAEEPHPMLDAMLNDYATWFMERMQMSLLKKLTIIVNFYLTSVNKCLILSLEINDKH